MPNERSMILFGGYKGGWIEMKTIIGIGAFALVIWLAMCLLAGQAGAIDFQACTSNAGCKAYLSDAIDVTRIEPGLYWSGVSVDPTTRRISYVTWLYGAQMSTNLARLLEIPVSEQNGNHKTGVKTILENLNIIIGG